LYPQHIADKVCTSNTNTGVEAMTKQQLEARIAELVRICDKETERADRAVSLLERAMPLVPVRHVELICLIGKELAK
jgi:hypothetical protein